MLELSDKDCKAAIIKILHQLQILRQNSSQEIEMILKIEPNGNYRIENYNKKEN